MSVLFILLTILLFASLSSCEEKATPKYVVFVTGDEEYRSEESMTMLAELLWKMGYDVKVCYALDSSGYVDPNNLYNIVGLEALDSADLMVMFTRFRQLPEEQLKYISDYAASGKPMVGFRTATHAFLYPDSTGLQHMNNDWPIKYFGQKWITHHGHFDDGNGILTKVETIDMDHPVLSGVTGFGAYSWLYHVDGGDHALPADAVSLLKGTALKSGHQMNDRLDRFPLENPVAWIRDYRAEDLPSRVFFTTLGHPYDFRELSMRQLAINGILWSLEDEDRIPKLTEEDITLGTYDPNNSGFGEKYKKGLVPKTFPKHK